MRVTQDLRLIDRGGTRYAQKYYVSNETPQQITDRYVSEFQGKGWRRIGGVSNDDYASTFCKNKLLGTLYFYGVREGSSAFSITVRTGGSQTEICD
nr:hypothetical protein [Dyella sp. ASV24]